jgi:hypothetical protein
LPPLDVEIETARLAAIRQFADFEAAFAKRRGELADQWTGNAEGFFANLGRYAAARQLFRAEQSPE